MASFNIGNYWVTKSQVDDLGDLEDGIEQLVISAIVQADISTAAVTFGQIGDGTPSTPVDGALWCHTNEGTTTEQRVLNMYDGNRSAWHAVGPAYSLTMPVAGRAGELWWDETHGLMRMYMTKGGVTDWHPTDARYQLWENTSGADRALGDVVVQDSTSDADRDGQCFTTSTNLKDPQVVGVIIQLAQGTTALNTSNQTGTGIEGDPVTRGLIAVPASGSDEITINVDCSAATGFVIAAGDAIVHSTTAGHGRGVGPLYPTSTPVHTGATGHIYEGNPYGCFAIATAASSGTDGTDTVTARMLPAIGTGRHIQFARIQIADGAVTGNGWLVANWTDGNWHDFDVTANPSSATVLQEPDHTPLMSADLRCAFAFDPSGGSGSVNAATTYHFSTSTNGVDGDAVSSHDKYFDAILVEYSHHQGNDHYHLASWIQPLNEGHADDHSGSGSYGPGNKFYWASQSVSGTMESASYLWCHGYTY